MNKIFNGDNAKSFRLIRPFDSSGQPKKLLTYTKTFDKTVFFPIVTDETQIFVALKNLLGPYGAIKSFYRYYFPKKFVWNSVLYNKPKVIDVIDEKHKKELVSVNLPGFRGVPRNKLMDRRNLILDQTDLMKETFVTNPRLMIRSSVMKYIQEIIPESICYFLFKNKDHVELVDPDAEAIENMKRDIDENSFEIRQISDLYDRYGESKYNEFNTESLKKQLENNDISEENYKEYLYSRTKLTSIGGPIIGIDEFGFDKFVISFPITLKTHKYFSIPYLTGKLNLLRQVLIDPNMVYQLSYIRFIVKLFEAYLNGSQPQDQYAKEMMNKEIAFHFYSERGIGFVINMDELKNSMKWNFNRFVRTFSNRLSLLVMHNLGSVTDKDLDKLEEEEISHNFDVVSNQIDISDTISKANKTLNDDINEAIKNDGILHAKNEGDKISKIATKIKTFIAKDITDDNIKEVSNVFTDKSEAVSDHIIPSKDSPLNTKQEVDLMEKVFKQFANSNNKNKKIVIEDKEDNTPITYIDKELDEVLGETEDTENTIDEEESVDINENLDEIKEREDEEESNPEDKLDDFTKNYGEFQDTDDSSVIDEEELYDEDDEEEYSTIEPDVNSDGLRQLKKQEVVEKTMTPKDKKRIETLKNKYKSIEINGTKVENIIGNAKKIEIESEKTNKVIETKDPKLMEKTTLSNFTKSYIKNNYQADIINSVRSLSVNKEVPMYMTKVDTKDTSDQFNDKITYTFQLEDEFKKKHTLKFDVPKLDDEGFFKMNGNRCYIKKQLIRKPIVKISSDKVYITTELNSYQIMREGIALNKGSEVVRRLFNEYFINNPNIKVEQGNCVEDNKNYLSTLEYDTLSQNYYSVIINPPSSTKKSMYNHYIQIFFSQKRIREIIKVNNLNTGYIDNKFPDNILPIAIDFTSKSIYSIDINNKGSVISTIITLLRDGLKDEKMIEFIKNVKTPKRRMCTKIDIQSKIVPLIIFLNYLFGWERVKSYFKESNINFSSKKIPNNNQLFIKFGDGYLYYNQYPIAGAILLNGLSLVNTEDYRYEDMNNQLLYLNFLEDTFGTKNIAKGWITAKESMLDFKTLQILETLNLPTDLLEIFLYCNDLLTDNYVKSESDVTNYRIRSSEIITDCLYKVLTDQYNTYKKRAGKNLHLSMPQNAVMSKVYQTEIMEYYNCLSPVGEINAYNTTTFKGPGGTKEEKAFTMEKRAFDESYYGTFAISTTDNGNAGIVKRLTTNPKIMNTLGFIGTQDPKDVSITDICNTEEALTPFVNKVDDPSRIAFVSIQNAHVGGILNASLPPVRTGVEKTIQYQVSDTFAKKAKQDGIISDIDEVNKKIFITYKDGTKDVIDYQNNLLKNSDAFNLETYDCFVKIGQKIKSNDLIAADNRFFKRDPITKEIIYTQARSAMVALMEGSYTEDDSSLITQTLSEKLSMNFTKCKSITLKPTDTIISYKKKGEDVHLGDPLLVFDETNTMEISEGLKAKADEFVGLDDSDEDSIADMIHQTPKANLDGNIEDIRVYWTVPIEQMSDSMAKLVKSYITRIKKEITEEEKFTNKPSIKRSYLEISVPNKNRLEGEEIDKKVGGIVIQYFISNNDLMSVGDKISLHSALKSVNSTVVPKALEPYRENGRLDGIFSIISTNARMINSVYISGFCGKILYDFTKSWAKNLLNECK